MDDHVGTRDVPGAGVPPEPGGPRLPSPPPTGALDLPRLPPRTDAQPLLVPMPPLPPPAPIAWSDQATGLPGDPTSRRAEIDRSRRRRGRVVLAVIGVLLLAGGAAIVLAFRSWSGERRLPEVAEIAPIRSTVVRSTFETGDDITEVTLHIDAAGEAFYWDDASVPSFDLVLTEDRWFYEVDGAWVRDRPDRDTRDFVDNSFLLGDGLTIDEALPPSMRTHLDVEDVSREIVSGRDVRHFEMVLYEEAFAEEDPDVYEAFSRIWGEPIEQDVPAGQLLVGTALDVWVDDDGWVWRFASRADLGNDGFDQTFVAWSDEPFAYPEPADGDAVRPPAPAADAVTGSGG